MLLKPYTKPMILGQLEMAKRLNIINFILMADLNLLEIISLIIRFSALLFEGNLLDYLKNRF